MELLWNSYGIPMEQLAYNTLAKGWQHPITAAHNSKTLAEQAFAICELPSAIAAAARRIRSVFLEAGSLTSPPPAGILPTSQ